MVGHRFPLARAPDCPSLVTYSLYVSNNRQSYGSLGFLFRSPAVTLEDKIRDLCAQVLTARDDEAVNQLLPQLREAIHEHCENVRVMVERTLPKI